MRGKLLLVVGLATGYVLGSRAGRPRYEQIKVGAQKVWNLPPMQQAVGSVKGFAGERVDVLQQKASSGAKKAVSSLLKLDTSKQATPTRSEAARAATAQRSNESTTEKPEPTGAAKSKANQKPAQTKKLKPAEPAPAADADE